MTLAPRRPKRWLFGHQEGIFAGNSKFLYLWMVAHRPDIEAIWITHRSDVQQELEAHGLPVCRRGTFAGVRAAATAGVYLYCFGPWDVGVAFGGGAFLVNLWHGVGLKAVQYGDPRSAASRASSGNPGWLRRVNELGSRLDPDLLLTTSPFTAAHFADQFRLPLDRCPPCGYPRLDVSLDDKLGRLVHKLDGAAVSRLRGSDVSEVYVYAPTYRDSARSFIGEALPDREALSSVLRARNAVLYLKLHHRTEVPTGWTEGPIRLWPSDTDLYSALPAIDGLITDYSSLHYDWIFGSDRGAILYTFDQDEYERHDRSLLYPFEENTAGWRAATFGELLHLIGSGQALQPHPKVANIRQRFWGENEGAACPRIVAVIEERLRANNRNQRPPNWAGPPEYS